MKIRAVLELGWGDLGMSVAAVFVALDLIVAAVIRATGVSSPPFVSQLANWFCGSTPFSASSRPLCNSASPPDVQAAQAWGLVVLVVAIIAFTTLAAFKAFVSQQNRRSKVGRDLIYVFLTAGVNLAVAFMAKFAADQGAPETMEFIWPSLVLLSQLLSASFVIFRFLGPLVSFIRRIAVRKIAS